MTHRLLRTLIQPTRISNVNAKYPENLEPEEWAKRFAEAVWIENERLSNLARLLAAMWGNPNG